MACHSRQDAGLPSLVANITDQYVKDLESAMAGRKRLGRGKLAGKAGQSKKGGIWVLSSDEEVRPMREPFLGHLDDVTMLFPGRLQGNAGEKPVLMRLGVQCAATAHEGSTHVPGDTQLLGGDDMAGRVHGLQ